MVDLATFDPQKDLTDPSMVDSLKVDTQTGDLTIVDSAILLMKPNLNGLPSKVHVSYVVFR